MASIQDALAQAGGGAGTGSMIGGPTGALIGAGAGLLGGLLGPSKPKLPAALRRIYSFQMSLADQQRRFAQSVPLSDPQEQAALASERGFAGQEQGDQRANLAAQFNPYTDQGNAGDFMSNINNQQTGQRMAISSQHLLAALAARRQGLLQASQMAGGATSAAAGNYQQQATPDFGAMFGNIARLLAYNKANQGQGNGGAQPSAGGTQPFVPSGGGTTNWGDVPASESGRTTSWGDVPAGGPVQTNAIGAIGAQQLAQQYGRNG